MGNPEISFTVPVQEVETFPIDQALQKIRSGASNEIQKRLIDLCHKTSALFLEDCLSSGTILKNLFEEEKLTKDEAAIGLFIANYFTFFYRVNPETSFGFKPTLELTVDNIIAITAEFYSRDFEEIKSIHRKYNDLMTEAILKS